MDLAITAMRQVLVLFLLMFAGFAGVKAGLIRMEGKKAFSDLLVNLICPCMILNSYFAEFQPGNFPEPSLGLCGIAAADFDGTGCNHDFYEKISCIGKTDSAVCLYLFQRGIYGVSADSGDVWRRGSALCQRLCNGI